MRRHWHTANETHILLTVAATLKCEGKLMELAPGGFNYMPACLVHEAWLPAESPTFITGDSAWDLTWVEGPPTAADFTNYRGGARSARASRHARAP